MKYTLLAVCLTLTACGTKPYKVDSAEMQLPENRPDVVISRSDDLKARPLWIKEGMPFRSEGDRIVSQALVTIPGDHRLESAYRICQNSAKGGIATAISQKLEYILQTSSEGTEMDKTTANYIGSEMASLTASSLRPSNQYWEKFASTNDSGERKTYYRIFCTVEMPQSDFKAKMYAAMREAEGKGNISDSFRQKLEVQWQKFVNAPVNIEAKRESASAE